MFSAFTPLAGGKLTRRTFQKPHIDLTGALNFTRQTFDITPIPHPPSIGAVQGLLYLFDQAELATMRGPTDSGPWSGAMPNLTAIFPNIQGGLQKVSG